MTTVTALVLRSVAAGRRYGFAIMEACGLPSGTVYPAMRRLERAGLLESAWEDADAARGDGRPRRRVYRVTESGRAALPEAERVLALAMERLAAAAPRGAPAPPPSAEEAGG